MCLWSTVETYFTLWSTIDRYFSRKQKLHEITPIPLLCSALFHCLNRLVATHNLIPNPLLKPTVLELWFNTLLPVTPESGDGRWTTKMRRDGSNITGIRRELRFRVIFSQKCNTMRSEFLPNRAPRTGLQKSALQPWVVYSCHMHLWGLKPFLLPGFSTGWYRKRCICT